MWYIVLERSGISTTPDTGRGGGGGVVVRITKDKRDFFGFLLFFICQSVNVVCLHYRELVTVFRIFQ